MRFRKEEFISHKSAVCLKVLLPNVAISFNNFCLKMNKTEGVLSSDCLQPERSSNQFKLNSQRELIASEKFRWIVQTGLSICSKTSNQWKVLYYIKVAWI